LRQRAARAADPAAYRAKKREEAAARREKDPERARALSRAAYERSGGAEGYAKQWRKANPEKAAAASARWRAKNGGSLVSLRSKYGVSVVEYEELLRAQGGLCAICRQPETMVDSKTRMVKRLAVDHCHATGRVRALLCHTCNLGLGVFKDDVARLRAAVAYLEMF
jgi:hypothetical protein